MRPLCKSLSAPALALICLACPALATAHTATVHDRDDTSSPLDIASVTLDHADGRLVYTIRTHDAFSRRDFLHKVGSFRVWFHLDADMKAEYELYALVSEEDGRIYANVGRAGPGMPTLVPASRPSAHAVRFVIPTRLLGRPASLRWQVESENRGRRDMAPDPRVGHRLR